MQNISGGGAPDLLAEQTENTFVEKGRGRPPSSLSTTPG